MRLEGKYYIRKLREEHVSEPQSVAELSDHQDIIHEIRRCFTLVVACGIKQCGFSVRTDGNLTLEVVHFQELQNFLPELVRRVAVIDGRCNRLQEVAHHGF